MATESSTLTPTGERRDDVSRAGEELCRPRGKNNTRMGLTSTEHDH
nr:unnamed protein product [Digitaria exilis]